MIDNARYDRNPFLLCVSPINPTTNESLLARETTCKNKKITKIEITKESIENFFRVFLR